MQLIKKPEVSCKNIRNCDNAKQHYNDKEAEGKDLVVAIIDDRDPDRPVLGRFVCESYAISG
jgi:hypothetical protein